MANQWFRFKQFMILQEKAAMKVTTDGCVFGAWAAEQLQTAQSKIENILDVGAGTGLLSLMAAQKSNADIVGVEIEVDTAEEAAQNFAASPWADRLKLVQGDILQLQFPSLFDVIICNPPFYESDLKGPDEKRNTAHHSGQLKLQQLFPVLFRNLSSEGTLYLLLPFRRKEELGKMIAANGFFIQAEVDLYPSKNATRWMVALKKYPPENFSYSTLHIKDSGGYTAAYRKLLQDFYLQL